jgi:hypothetical protein
VIRRQDNLTPLLGEKIGGHVLVQDEETLVFDDVWIVSGETKSHFIAVEFFPEKDRAVDRALDKVESGTLAEHPVVEIRNKS